VALLYLTGFHERFVSLVDQDSEEMFAGSYDLIDAIDEAEEWQFPPACLSGCWLFSLCTEQYRH